MAYLIFPSSFRCDCGHQSDFFENTVRGMSEMTLSKRKPQVLVDDDREDTHRIVFAKGKAISMICPRLGECAIVPEMP